jgi:hypothetical protein
MDEELVTVARFSTPQEAHLAKAQLAANDIDALILDEHTVGANWLFSNAVGGVRVQVAASEVERALEILDAEDVLDESGPVDEGSGWGACPACGSERSEFFSEKKKVSLLLLFLGIPLLFQKKKLKCQDCGNVWNYN